MYHRPPESRAEPAPAILPPVAQPKAWQFFAHTWSGRIIVLNTIVFLVEVLLSRKTDFNSIPFETLLMLGAKEPVLLAHGEYWRLVTPMFLHGNLLHILFNNWALYAVAFQVEALLGPRKFLGLYFLAGIGGNILSAIWSLSLSVGASGALFGLLGCAWYFEWLIQRRVKEITGFKPKAGAYTVMVVANILFGFIIPQVDNAAHIGGLLVGVVFAYVLLRATPNRLLPLQLNRARVVGLLASAVFIAMAVVGATPSYVRWHLTRAMNAAEPLVERYFYLSRILQLGSSIPTEVWHHFRLALELKDFNGADLDFEFLSQQPDSLQKLKELEQEFRMQGNLAASQWLQAKTPESLH